MKCATMVDDRTMNVALNEKLLEEVKCFEFLLKFIMNEVVRMCGGMKKMFV